MGTGIIAKRYILQLLFRSAYGGDGKWHLVGDSDMEPLKEIFNGKIRLRKDANIQWIQTATGQGHESISADELVEQTELLGEHDMSDSLDILWEENADRL